MYFLNISKSSNLLWSCAYWAYWRATCTAELNVLVQLVLCHVQCTTKINSKFLILSHLCRGVNYLQKFCVKTRESIESISNICLVEQIERPLIATRILIETKAEIWIGAICLQHCGHSVICSIWMKLIFDLNEFKWTNRRWLISITLINSESTQQCQRTRAISIATTTSMQNKLKLMLSQNNRPWTNALMVSRIPTQIRLTMETFAIFCVCLRLR